MTKRWFVGIAVLLVSVLCVGPVFASMFGEENATLVSILTELLDSGSTLADISKTADQIAGAMNEVASVSRRVYAGIEQVQHYSFDEFLSDFKNDFYRQYPGIGRLEYASENFAHWSDTSTRSPFTAYEAISAVAADVSQPLRDDIKAKRANIDRELILASEAANGFAAAQTADEVNDSLSKRITALSDEARNPSPGRAQQLTAQASFMLLAQQSQVMRLLSRTVRMDSTMAALDFGRRIEAHNTIYQTSDAMTELQTSALSSATLVNFGDQ